MDQSRAPLKEGLPALAVGLSLLTMKLSPGTLSPEDERALTAAAARQGASVNVVFVEQALQDGWFSHWHAQERAAVISLAGLDQLTSVRAEAFVAYEVLLYGISALSADYEPRTLLHPETRACLFDLCQNKAEVGLKLQAGHLCAGCLQKLAARGRWRRGSPM